MAKPLFHYSTRDTLLSIGGFPIDTGMSESNFVEIEPAQAYDKVIGADGSYTRFRTGDNGAGIKIRTKFTSPGNIILTSLFLSDRFAPNGAPAASFLWVHHFGAFSFSAHKVWIEKYPAIQGSHQPQDLEWQLQTDDLVCVFPGFIPVL